LKGLTIELLEDKGKTPLIYIEVASSIKGNIDTHLFYGHFDKQPHGEGWREGLHPTKPVIINEMLYGRGGADDGYSVFFMMTAIKVIQEQGLPHSRFVFLMEGDEESGSRDMEYYMKKLKERIGERVKMIWIVDSGAANYDTLWITESLRGCIISRLQIEVSKAGVHSGSASGVTPECFRISRMLLNRIEDVNTGKLHNSYYVTIPTRTLTYAQEFSKTIDFKKNLHMLEGVKTTQEDNPLNNDYLT